MKKDLNLSQRRLQKITRLIRKLNLDFSADASLADAVIYEPSGHGDAMIRIAVSRAELVDRDPFETLSRYIAHELGHWLQATDKNRLRRDYGLPVEETRHSDLNEVKAQILERLILERFGIKTAFPRKRHGTFKSVYAMKKWEKEEGIKLVSNLFKQVAQIKKRNKIALRLLKAA